MIWSVAGLVAVLVAGILVAWLRAGLSEWALLNRMLGFLVLLGYAAVPGLVTLIAGERGRAILADIFVIAAVVICATQLLAYAVHRFVMPLPPEIAKTDRAKRLKAFGCVTEMDIAQLDHIGTRRAHVGKKTV